MTRIINIKDAPPWWKDVDEFVYIGRGSPWGNPFSASKFGREHCIDLYRAYLQGFTGMTERAKKELKGKTLVCWCAPLPCHGDVLAALCDEEDET